MDALFLVLDLVAILAGLILFSLVVLWFVPVLITVRFVSAFGQRELGVSVHFGPAALVSTTHGGRTSTDILVLGYAVFTFDGEPGTAGKEVTQQETPDHLKHGPDLVPVIINLISPAVRILGVVYREGVFERCDGRVRIGLGDPAATGMFYGSYWAARFLFTKARIFIHVEPVFDKRLLEADLVARYRIDHLLRILLQAAREILRPEVRAGISAIRSVAGAAS